MAKVAKSTTQDKDKMTEDTVVPFNELPDNLFITSNGTRLLFQKNKIPPSIVQRLTTAVAMNASMASDGRPRKADDINTQSHVAFTFLTFITELLGWKIFKLYDGLPEDKSWIRNLKRTNTLVSTMDIDWQDEEDIELLYVIFFAVSVEDLEDIIELISKD